MNPSAPALGGPHPHTLARGFDVHPWFIVAIWLAMAALINPFGEFPLNDDWVYTLAVKSVLEKGFYQFPSPSSANVGPQVYWGAMFCLPFGFSFTALRLSTLVLGLVGVFSLYGTVKVLTKDAGVSLIAALVLAVNPLYFSLSNSFMTDVPFIAVVLLGLYLMIRGFSDDAPGLLAAGVGFALLSILIRQFGYALVVGFAVAYVLKYGPRPSNLLKMLLLLALGLAVQFVYQYWLVHTARTPFLYRTSDARRLMPRIDTLIPIAKTALNALLYIGFFVFPCLLLRFLQKPAPAAGMPPRRVWPYAVAAVAVFAGLWWTNKVLPDNPKNSLTAYGLGPMTLRDTFILSLNYPEITRAAAWGWTLVRALSVLAATAVVFWLVPPVGAALGRLRDARARPDIWPVGLVATTLLLSLGIVCLVTNRVTIFDRYFLVAAPLIVILLVIAWAGKASAWTLRGWLATMAVLSCYAVFSVAVTHDYMAWNRARWAATEQLMQKDHVSPERIDGGYEFNGWYLNKPNYVPREGYSFWYIADDEYLIASGPLPNYDEVARYPFRRWFLRQDAAVLVLKRTGVIAR